MATPTTRTEFKKYCLRELGHPVIEINVDEDQVQDRIDDALDYYRDFHYDGTEHDYYKHVVTSSDITNKYITLPETIIGVVGVMPIGTGVNSNNLFNLRYQITLNEIYDWAHGTFANYYMSMERIALMQELFVGKQLIRFNRHTDRLYIDMDWENDITADGDYLIIECYRKIDPTSYTDIYDDIYLKRYATALIKKQWGANLSKFGGVAMLGGVTMNGETIYSQAIEEIQKLEDKIDVN